MASRPIRVNTPNGFNGVIKLDVRDFVPDRKRRHVDPASEWRPRGEAGVVLAPRVFRPRNTQFTPMSLMPAEIATPSRPSASLEYPQQRREETVPPSWPRSTADSLSTPTLRSGLSTLYEYEAVRNRSLRYVTLDGCHPRGEKLSGSTDGGSLRAWLHWLAL